MANKKDSRLEIRLPEKELMQIQDNAKACGKTVSAYVRESALNMYTFTCDNSCIVNHTNEISAYRNAINQLIFTIKKTGNYTPVDLEYILEKTNEMLKSEKDFLNIYKKSIESEKKLIARTVRNTIKKRLEE